MGLGRQLREHIPDNSLCLPLHLTARRISADLVFPSERNPKRPFEFRKHWNIAVQKAGLKDFRFHDLRHSAASHLAMNGATLLEIAEVLRHLDRTVTCRYSHLCSDHKQKLIDKLMGSVMEG